VNGEYFDQLFEKDRHPWEPRDPYGWLEIDPLLRAFRQAEIVSPNIEAAVVSFHHAWIRLPREMRSQALREREIAGALVQTLPEWREMVPGLSSVGVGIRGVREPQLTAVFSVEQGLSDRECGEVRKRWAKRAFVESRAAEYKEAREVPSVVEVRPTPTLLGKVPTGEFLFGEPDPTPHDAPVLQSGDKIGSESPIGIREFGTLTCLVSTPGSTVPLLLGSGHVFREAGYDVLNGQVIPKRVGKVKKLWKATDVALAELSSPYLCDYRCKGPDMVPAAPVIATGDMPVQMYGAKSRHQLGYLDQAVQIPANASAAGIFPMFTVTIKCVHGDSGALLVTGRGTEPAVPSWQTKHMSPEYLDSLTCALLGVLKAGPPPGADPNVRPQAYFIPMLQVLNEVGVEAWVR
jgi:hypothetical protein